VSAAFDRLGRGRVVAILALALSALALPSPAPAASPLTIAAAGERSLEFARRTCAHDRHCVRYAVLSCRREGGRVVVCRILDERDTRVQGKYRCERKIRVVARGHGPVPVTGLGPWRC
jgi:hypothetical protein